ncbi:hypothetical protein NKG05_16050 [Oerskovia sp. M15]
MGFGTAAVLLVAAAALDDVGRTPWAAAALVLSTVFGFVSAVVAISVIVRPTGLPAVPGRPVRG